MLADMPFHVFVHSNGEMRFRAASFGQPNGWGTLGTCLPIWFGLDSTQVDGDLDLLDAQFAGDVAVRADVSADELAPRMSDILTKLLGKPIRLTFREVDRETLVVHGQYGRKPDSDGPLAVEGDPPRTSTRMTLTQSLDGILRDVASRMKLQLVHDILDSRTIRLHYRSDQTSIEPERIDTILNYLGEETSLQFKRESRPVRVLFAEKGRE
jgi:hypothetical protein